jgi:diguanylate cyclase (GGDEF)-like protein
MRVGPVHLDALFALALCMGAQLLVVCMGLVVAGTFRDRALLLHAGATLLGVLATGALLAGQGLVAEAALLLMLAAAGMQLRDLVSHAGALRNPRRALVGVCTGLLPLLALACIAGWNTLLVGVGAWAAVMTVLMLRAWRLTQPWMSWVVMGYVPLLAASIWLGWRSLDGEPDPPLPLAVFLTAWAATTYLATIWRSRIFGETRVRLAARNRVDPLTGLPTPLVFHERVHAVRHLVRRFGHPSVLLLVHIENLQDLQSEFGPEVAESAVLVAASRIRQAMREGDVAARISHSRFAVLCEGIDLAECVSNVASRVLVAGLKEPLPAAPSEFLHFRVALALVPVSDVPAAKLLERLSQRMQAQLVEASERRIVTVSAGELA